MGDTEIEVTTFAFTVSVAVPLIPLSEAVTVAVPGVTPVAKPVEFTVAMDVVPLVQLAVELIFAVDPSL